MPDYFCEFGKREDPQEERKDQATFSFKEKLDLISAEMNELLCDYEKEQHSRIEKLKARVRDIQKVADEDQGSALKATN